jgi:hypothetical protein
MLLILPFEPKGKKKEKNNIEPLRGTQLSTLRHQYLAALWHTGTSVSCA